MTSIFQDNAALAATTVAQRQRMDENNVIRTNLAYARHTRGQFPHARALVMAEAITQLVLTTTWRAS